MSTAAQAVGTAAHRLWWWAADYAFVLDSWLRSARRHPRPVPGVPINERTDRALPGVPVLLLPGIYESWRFMEPLTRRLHRAGHPVLVVPLGLNSRSVAAAARKVRWHLRAHHPGMGVVIVAHSKGGLIGKQLMLDLQRLHRLADGGGTPAQRPTAAVHGMVSINTPYAGSAYASMLPLAHLRALAPGALAHLSSQVSVDERIIAIRASWDPHIPGAGDLAGAQNIEVGAAGHFSIIGDGDTADRVCAGVAELGEVEPTSG